MKELILQYTEKNSEFIKEKTIVLEKFRTNEDLLRVYEDTLGDLEKIKMNSQIDIFDNIKDRLSNYLLSFNPDDIEANINEVKSVIQFIKTKQKELKKLSDVFLFIKKTWISFLTRRNPENIYSNFIEEVNEKINNLNESFFTGGINDLGRMEELSEDLKTEVLKIIALFEDLYILTEKNVFIGEEALAIKRDIEEFLNVDFYELSLLELYKRKEELTLFITPLLSKEKNLITKALPVVKIENKLNKELYYYSVKVGDYILEFENKEISENDIIVDINKFVYIDNYPEKGIFNIDDIKKRIDISKNQFKLMNDFDEYTSKTFFSMMISFFIVGGIYLFDVIGIFAFLFASIMFSGIFYISYKKLLSALEKKYKVKNAFFFIPTNYYFLSEGDIHFNYRDLIYTLLVNSDKTILRNGE